MNAVAAAAGVSKGLLHYHFQSKEHLLIEAQRATFRQMHERFEERFAMGDKGMDTALDALDNLWDSLFSMRHWAPFMVETISLAAQQSPIRKAADAFYAESMTLLDSGLRAVFEGEEDRLVIPPERLGAMVRVCVHGFIVELAYARDEAELEAAHRTYKDFRQLFGTWMLGDVPDMEDAR